MRFKALQEQVKELRAAQGWHDTSLERRTMFLLTELGEVAEEVRKLVDANGNATELAQIRDNLGMEIYDVVWNLCDLANLAGIDLEAAFAKKAAINRGRRW